ncbi:helix-turn-helix transcriptional regulator [Bosea sp. ASV33]|uniref:helix-turn-helix domain-containing protein n=1 Tax=Bosea sp. ASV33 TaxID=2795106 RepID=UPI0018EC2F87|nr:helix-turn-helix transcriptional regulator [Bosea sp. ASV33]
MRDFYGDPKAGNRLRRSRIARGFVSAGAAASAFGWSAPVYIAHEAGSRAWSIEQIKKYAEAFDVPAEWLGQGLYPADERQLDRVRVIGEAPVAEITERLAQLASGRPYVPQWRRLVAARAARGFRNAGRAAAFFGWNNSTYAGHESGKNRLTPETAERYGQAFEVSAQWLLDGSVPSGLADGREPTSEVPATQGPALADYGRPLSKRPARGRIQASVLVPYLSDIPGRGPIVQGRLTFPASFMPKELDNTNLFALRITEEFSPAADLQPNDVVLVSPTLLSGPVMGYLSLLGGVPVIHHSTYQSEQEGFVGSILAIIWRASLSLS